MNTLRKPLKIIRTLIAVVLIITTIIGILSFNIHHQYEVINQYGTHVKMWGYGIYAHDSYFRAPLFIGTDIVMLFLVLPLYIKANKQLNQNENTDSLVDYLAILAVILYYSTSIAIGVTYNQLHLVYIVLFSCSLFTAMIICLKIYSLHLYQISPHSVPTSKGLKEFLLISGFSLFVAWLPDIIISLIQNKPLALLEVYTTEITNVLDMGIISPFLLITYYLIKKQSDLGYVLLKICLKLCMCIGVILPIQTLCQLIAKIELPLPALITKVGIFVVLAVVAKGLEYQVDKSNM